MRFALLQPDEYHLIEPVVTAELRNFLPSPEQSTFPSLFDGANLAGFVWVEHLYHFQTVCVMPEYRGRPDIVRPLIEAAVAAIPKGHAAICLPDPKQEHLKLLAKRMGARQLSSRVVLRKDVF